MFHIRWRKRVSRKLLDECAKADPSLLDAILDAMSNVESVLRNEPEFAGESRDSGKRIIVVDPLSVIYRIDHRLRAVHVTGVKVRHRKK